MKIIFNVFILFFVGIFSFSHAQSRKYVMLAMLDSAYQTHHYTLDSKELYGVSHTVELYNIYIDESTLVLFSVLPSFQDGQNWEETDLSENSAVIGHAAFHRLMRDKYSVSGDYKKSMGYRLIKYEGGKYYSSKNCLFEIFNIRNYPGQFNTPFGTLNMGQPKKTIREMEAEYAASFPDSHFPLDPTFNHPMNDRELLAREYLSKEVDISGVKAYQFWTFTDWGVSDGRNIQRGIDRFIYMPGRGIVAGSYDFYFFFTAKLDFSPEERRHRLSRAQRLDNMLEERVMIAEEILRE